MATLEEIAVLLVKHFGYHEGLYELSFSIQVGVGQVGPTPETQLPGAAFGIGSVGLRKTSNPGPLVVDAAEVNPRQKVGKGPRVAKSTKAKPSNPETR
jgi:hypothetical protein